MLEVRIRLRVPYEGQEMTVKQEKWLIVDDFNAGIAPLLEGLVVKPLGGPVTPVKPAMPGSPNTSSAPGTPVRGAGTVTPSPTPLSTPTRGGTPRRGGLQTPT